ncbi:Putative MetA-pathway of phenol degradation [Methylorubrum salsuginis]|uniref:Putative MetA-pathway of phenol degradation n=2 Tax=Methylorubrum salsuginis TaxID=414703 RepID=A0A1I4M330_9HYPH|nr:Putative MetA-pathway of phenol degradation [Methylorubrum salsuginis]
MMLKKFATAAGAFAAVTLSATVSYAQATTIPGEQVGLAVGAPLPEGIYAIDTFIYRRNDTRFSTDTAINVPVLVWSTGYKIFGANIQPLLAQPTVFGFPNNPPGVPNRDFSVNVGTLVGSIFAWDLGGGFGVSYLAAVHLNDLNAGRALPQFSSNTYRQGFAASYTADGWNLTANLTHNFYDSPGRFEGAIGQAIGPLYLADALLLDLTATKKFGKFEIGAVAYGVTDLPLGGADFARASAQGYARAGRFAVGGLVGYDFGPFTAQLMVARDVAVRTNGTESTDGFIRLIAPLYTPPKAAAVEPVALVRKY